MITSGMIIIWYDCECQYFKFNICQFEISQNWFTRFAGFSLANENQWAKLSSQKTTNIAAQLGVDSVNFFRDLNMQHAIIIIIIMKVSWLRRLNWTDFILLILQLQCGTYLAFIVACLQIGKSYNLNCCCLFFALPFSLLLIKFPTFVVLFATQLKSKWWRQKEIWKILLIWKLSLRVNQRIAEL